MLGERKGAILIGLLLVFIMGGSLIGFAVLSSRGPSQAQQGSDIPPIVDYELSPGELVFVLQTGRVVIENFYSPDCTECMQNNILLDSFVNTFPNYIVMESVVGNESKLQMIGRGGSIVELGNLTEESLMNTFCDLAILQPRECIIRGF